MAWNLQQRQAYLRSPEGQKVLADIKASQQLRELKQALGSSIPPVELPTSDMLRCPGELERVLEGIKTRFRLTDQRHRENIDREVILRVRTARLINSSRIAMHEILGGKWADYWRKSNKKPSEALRFVFGKVHSDPKKASFYYRATRALFEEGVDPDDLPKRIAAEGGYRALAEANVRTPRSKKTTGSSTAAAVTSEEPNGDDGAEVQTNTRPAPLIVDDEDQTTTPRGRKHTPQPDADGSGDGEAKTVLLATFEGDGHDFLRLSVGCYATVGLEVMPNDAGRRAIKIFCAFAEE